MRATEIAHHVFFGVAAFLMSDHDATVRAKCGQPAWHGSIVGKAPIAMELDPVCKAAFHIIHGEWTPGMPCDLHTLPGAEIVVNFPTRFAKFFLDLLNRGIEIDIVRVRVILYILEAPFELKDRFFKIERL